MVATEHALFDYIRDLEASGINNATWELIRLYDDTVLATGTTGPDADPNTTIDGMLAVAEATYGYPGPVKYRVTDPITGITREHTSKSIGAVGPIRLIDLPFMFAMMRDGVVQGFESNFTCTPTGTAPPAITVAPGAAFGHGMYYRCMAPQQVSPAAGGAQPRIDLIVIRYYLPGHAQEGRAELAVLPGTPAASPVAPNPTQDATGTKVWEVPLGSQKMNAGQNIATSVNFTDLRVYTAGPNIDSRYVRKDATDARVGGLTNDGDLLVRTSDGLTNIGYLKTTPSTSRSLQLRNASDFIMYDDDGVDITYRVDGLTGHVNVSGPGKPNVGPHSGAGSGASVVVNWGNDSCFEFTLTTGTNPVAGDLLGCIWKNPRQSANYHVSFQPVNGPANDLGIYTVNRLVNRCDMKCRAAPAAKKTYQWTVHVLGSLL